MMVFRWLIGFAKALINLWSQDEWFYYAKTGLDPKLPAFQRWEISTRIEDKKPDSEAERIMPLKNRWVILRDKFMLRPEDVLFFTTDQDKVNAVLEQYQRELRTRTSGEFYYKMVKGRHLEDFHEFRVPTETIPGTPEAEAEQEREKFLR